MKNAFNTYGLIIGNRDSHGKGTDLKTVQDRMGHANGAITLNWYAHAVPENDAKAAQLVGDLYGSEYKQEPTKKRKTA